MELFGIYWASIDNFWYAPLVAILIFLVIKNYIRIKQAADFLVSSEYRTTIFQHFSLKKSFTKMVLLITGLVFLFLAFLQPQWGKKDEKVVQEGRDVLVLLDISRSMLAQDFKPNRLEFAKLKIKHLLSQLDADRVGLVLFSGTAFLQCPLTQDYGAFSMFLDQVDVETISSGTTAIDTALSTAVDVYSLSPERKSRLVILVTDGEDFSLDLAGIEKKAEELKLTVFALGVGTLAGAPIPILDQQGNQTGHERDEKGSPYLSKLNESLLKKVCSQMHGTYFAARYDDGDIDALVGKVKGFDKEKISDRQVTKYEERYPWFLGIAFILLLLEWVL